MNPFKDLTVAQVEAHNAEIARRRAGGTKREGMSEAVVAKTTVEHWQAPKSVLAEDKLNKTEHRFYMILKYRNLYSSIFIHPVKLRLAATRCFYTPDFMTIYGAPIGNPLITFWEVKGAHIFEDSTIKLKTAAAEFPCFQFVRAQWKDGKWTETVIRA